MPLREEDDLSQGLKSRERHPGLGCNRDCASQMGRNHVFKTVVDVSNFSTNFQNS